MSLPPTLWLCLIAWAVGIPCCVFYCGLRGDDHEFSKAESVVVFAFLWPVALYDSLRAALKGASR